MTTIRGLLDGCPRGSPEKVEGMHANHFYESIDGWFNFRAVYDQAIREAKDGDVMVELGSWYGRSAAYMAVEIAKSGRKVDFYCVDTWQGSADSPWMAAHLADRGGSAFPFFRENLERGGVWDLVKPLQLPSCAAADRFAVESVDFIMIDAAHDYSSVRQDVRAWLPKLRTGGVMAGDDANWPGVLIGVHETIPMSELMLVNDGTNWLHRKGRPDRGRWSIRRRDETGRSYLAYIPYVNRPDLLERAVASVRALWDNLVVIDQSSDGLSREDHPWVDCIAGVFRCATPSMSFTQVMNWAQAEALERGVEHLVFMHNDAECSGDVASRVLESARSRPRAGVVFTNYDALAVFQVPALRDVGPWDETFRWYFADNDYYRRLLLHGWEQWNFGGQEVAHRGSQTLRSDPAIATQVAAEWRWHEDHYRHKWGGLPGQERFSIPYNGAR
jgi:predicted O-methyltransferase YrrM